MMVYIGLGGNLEDPVQSFCNCINAINSSENMALLSCSSLYQSAPVGYSDQPDFLNAVISVETSFSPTQLLGFLQHLENRYGRVRTFQNAPRTLDLDILLYNDQEIVLPDVVIPHPRLLERAFVIIPLLEIMPNLLLPDGRRIVDSLQKVEDQAICVYFDNRWTGIKGKSIKKG